MSERALDLFAAAGAEIDRSGNIVKINQEIVDKALASAPSSFTLTPAIRPGRSFWAAIISTSRWWQARQTCTTGRGGRRSGNYRDYCDFIRLAHHFNIVHLIGTR